MKWIGLTGGLGSGKSTVTNLLRIKGWPVIDADRIAHQVLEPGTIGLTKVQEEIGADLVQHGKLDRKELAQRVFQNPELLEKLEKIVHPLVQDEVKRQKMSFQQLGFQMVFYDVPLLFEKKIDGFDATIVVYADEDVVRERLRKRNSWSDQEIELRLNAQIPLSQKLKLANHVIHNNGELKDLEAEVDRVLSLL